MADLGEHYYSTPEGKIVAVFPLSADVVHHELGLPAGTILHHWARRPGEAFYTLLERIKIA